ncbi:hypothetical protein MUCCIDRAFT_167314 [Mucor lusitanicus CBS 277.49]|jgi:hypothetical protein|uniref:Uncharacterized protein n=1 Tax=Mucor lusitanicus CBS 277.49 TaxID=747725 RepID=A0A168HJW4_MUCCL|nr:hypothetical protein MUCCIDRAFT_167314 [Mucor lusitanicus CBS 277.49]
MSRLIRRNARTNLPEDLKVVADQRINEACARQREMNKKQYHRFPAFHHDTFKHLSRDPDRKKEPEESLPFKPEAVNFDPEMTHADDVDDVDDVEENDESDTSH